MTTETAGDCVGVRAAARELDLAHTTVSRYLAQHPELNRGTTDRPLVDVAELRAHRADNVNGAKSANHAGGLGAGTTGGDTGNVRSYSNAKADRERYAADMARLQYEEKVGRLVDRKEVEDAAQEAGQVLKSKLAARNRALAERLAALADPRAIAAELDAADRDILTDFTDTIRASIETESENREAS